MTFFDVAAQAMAVGGADIIDEHGNIISVLKSGECVRRAGLDTCKGTGWEILRKEFSFQRALTLVNQGKRVTFTKCSRVFTLSTLLSCTFEDNFGYPHIQHMDLSELYTEKFSLDTRDMKKKDN